MFGRTNKQDWDYDEDHDEEGSDHSDRSGDDEEGSYISNESYVHKKVVRPVDKSLFRNKAAEALGKFEIVGTREFVVSGILSQAPQTGVLIKVLK
jgi:hypothetical protein